MLSREKAISKIQEGFGKAVMEGQDRRESIGKVLDEYSRKKPITTLLKRMIWGLIWFLFAVSISNTILLFEISDKIETLAVRTDSTTALMQEISPWLRQQAKIAKERLEAQNIRRRLLSVPDSSWKKKEPKRNMLQRNP